MDSPIYYSGNPADVLEDLAPGMFPQWFIQGMRDRMNKPVWVMLGGEGNIVVPITSIEFPTVTG